MLVLGGLFLFGLLYYFLLVSPALSRQKRLETTVARGKADLSEMMALKAKWNSFKENQGEAEKILARRGEKFTLLSFLEGVSRKEGIHNKIQYMKPLASTEVSEGTEKWVFLREKGLFEGALGVEWGVSVTEFSEGFCGSSQLNSHCSARNKKGQVNANNTHYSVLFHVLWN